MNYISKDAFIDSTGTFRYCLSRRWTSPGAGPQPCLFCMLNPSTADAMNDDATIRKCVGFASRWGFQGIEIVNLYAYRTRSPVELRKAGYQVGPNNNNFIMQKASYAGLVVAAWGAHARDDRVTEVLEILTKIKSVYCLGTTQTGQPRHPLMQPYSRERVLFKGLAA